MAHISRKELKQDKIRETLAHGAEVALAHQRAVWYGVAIFLVVALAVIGWRFYSERQTVKARAALAEAMEVFDARIRAMNEPEQQGEITYVDAKNKFTDAANKFSEVAAQYPRTVPGQIAAYYAGLSHLQLGSHEEAEKSLRQVERSGHDEFAALARFQLALLAERTGKGEEAVKLYKQLIDRPATLLPKPMAMLALADYYRKTDPAEATKLYEQIREEFPNSPVAEEVQRRLETIRPAT